MTDLAERILEDLEAGNITGTEIALSNVRDAIDALTAAPTSVVDGVSAENRMITIEDLITDLQNIKDSFGNTCVYIRRFGLSWGAVALNYRDADARNGVFDEQTYYEELLTQRAEQVKRLIADRDEWMAKACNPTPPAPQEPSDETQDADALQALEDAIDFLDADNVRVIGQRGDSTPVDASAYDHMLDLLMSLLATLRRAKGE